MASYFMKPLLQLIRDYWVILSILLALFISFLSLTPLSQFPAVPGNDKSHHFIAYSVLVLPLMLKKPNYWLVIFILFNEFFDQILLNLVTIN